MNYDELVKRLDALINVHPGALIRKDSLLAGTPAGVFFEQQITHIQAEVYRAKVPRRRAFDLIPADMNFHPGAQSFKVRMFESVGEAKVIGPHSSDLPLVGLRGVEQTFPFKTIGVAYETSWDEIQAGMMAGTPLDPEKGVAARLAVEQLQNRLAWDGDETIGFHGVLNHPNIPRVILPDGIDSGTSAANIILYLNSIVNAVEEASEHTESPTVMALATDAYSYITSTPRSTTSDTTIAKYFLDNNPSIQRLEKVPEFNGKGPAGEDLIWVYSPEPRIIRRPTPLAFTQFPVQPKGLVNLTPCVARQGGIATSYPLGMAIAEIPAP